MRTAAQASSNATRRIRRTGTFISVLSGGLLAVFFSLSFSRSYTLLSLASTRSPPHAQPHVSTFSTTMIPTVQGEVGPLSGHVMNLTMLTIVKVPKNSSQKRHSVDVKARLGHDCFSSDPKALGPRLHSGTAPCFQRGRTAANSLPEQGRSLPSPLPPLPVSRGKGMDATPKPSQHPTLEPTLRRKMAPRVPTSAPRIIENASLASARGRFDINASAPWKCPCGSSNYILPRELVLQIHEHISLWHDGGMTSEVIDLAFKSKDARLYHFSSRDGLLTGRFQDKVQRTVYFKRVVQFMAEANSACGGLPNAEFVLSHDDHPRILRQNMLPLMAPITDATHADISFPYVYTFKNEKSEWRQLMWGRPLPSTLNSCRPWERRKNAVFFRGGCTGPTTGYQGPLWRYYARQRFSRLANKHPDLFSGGMTELCDGLRKDPWKSQVRAESSEIALVGMPHMCSFKHLLQLDGNTASGRFPYLLWMGATIFKQASPFREHWYPLLKPWENFIPVDEALGDLPELARWAHTHPKEAAEIARRGKKLAEEHLTLEAVQCYVHYLLGAFGALQAFDPRKLEFAVGSRSE
jgi:hypothetical protein